MNNTTPDKNGQPEETVLTISTDDLNKLDIETLPLTPVVLDEKSRRKEIESACKKLRERPFIGFDTETKPSFKKGTQHPVSLLQLANDSTVVLVRLVSIQDFEAPKWDPLKRLLASPLILKAGVGIHDDALGLAKDHGLITHNTIDLRSLAKADSMDVLSLTKIYSILFGKRLSKRQQLSDWERHELSDAQKNYAGLDAYAGFKIFEKLRHLATPQMITKKLYGGQKSGKRVPKRAKRQTSPQEGTKQE